MKQKRIWISLWLLTLLAIFIVTLVNHSPYFLLGGSSSIAPIMEELLNNYPENHKNGDFNYVSSASSGAPPRVESGLFGIGWLSEDYLNPNTNMFTFQLLRDGLVIVYNIPPKNLTDPNKILNFTPEIVQDLYLHNKSWQEVFPGQIIGNLSVKPFTRANGSGTRTVFDNQVLGGRTFYRANTVDSSSSMLSLGVGSIGYTSYADLNQAINPQVTAGTWNGVTADFETIGNSYTLWRPFTGLINYSYKYANDIAYLLKWIFSFNSKVEEIFSKYGPRIELDNPINSALANWLRSFPNRN